MTRIVRLLFVLAAVTVVAAIALPATNARVEPASDLQLVANGGEGVATATTPCKPWRNTGWCLSANKAVCACIR